MVVVMVEVVVVTKCPVEELRAVEHYLALLQYVAIVVCDCGGGGGDDDEGGRTAHRGGPSFEVWHGIMEACCGGDVVVVVVYCHYHFYCHHHHHHHHHYDHYHHRHYHYHHHHQYHFYPCGREENIELKKMVYCCYHHHHYCHHHYDHYHHHYHHHHHRQYYCDHCDREENVELKKTVYCHYHFYHHHHHHHYCHHHYDHYHDRHYHHHHRHYCHHHHHRHHHRHHRQYHCDHRDREENVELKKTVTEQQDVIMGLRRDLAGASARLSDISGEMSESQKQEMEKNRELLCRRDNETTELRQQMAKLSAIIDKQKEDIATLQQELRWVETDR